VLKIYAELFEKLNAANVKYVVYKGLDHIAQDLLGKGGDIDIYVSRQCMIKFEKIVLNSCYSLVKYNGSSRYYYGLDIDTKLPSLLDVVTTIPLGKKPYKNIDLCVNYENLDVIKHRCFPLINIVNKVDSIKLMLLIKSSAHTVTKGDIKNFERINETLHEKGNYLNTVILKIFGHDFMYKAEDKSEKDYSSVFDRNYKKILNHNKDNLKNKLTLLFRIIQQGKLVLGFPFYKRKKRGQLIAFVGVDGAGKTTIIAKLEDMEFFKALSLKSIYFGNNEYWIPGLNWLANNIKNKKVMKVLSLAARIDRQLRVFIAIYYMWMGRDVVADRYYYDDIYTLIYNNKIKKISFTDNIMLLIRNITSVRMLYTPDKTIFLNVSPEIAYERKQDYSYDKLTETISGYQELLKDRKEVVVVDADQPMDLVFNKVVNEILR